MNKLVGDFMKHINKQEAVFTSQVYLEVCEVKRYHEVQYFYNAEINKIVITAKKTKSGPTCAFIPTTVYENLTFLRLQSFVSTNPYEINYLVIVYSDSTCVYYELSNGLIEPTDTSAKHLKENKQDKLDSDLRKHRELVEQAALMRLAVSIKKN